MRERELWALAPDSVEAVGAGRDRRFVVRFAEEPGEAVRARLAAHGDVELSVGALPAFWARRYAPFSVGPLSVAPEGDPRELLVLEPGTGFGPSHASTRLCLEWLVARAAEGPPSTLLDVGTGSGILALAALRLGVERVTATDIDPEARALALENARRNGLEVRLELSARSPRRLRARFPIVLANLPTPPLDELALELVAAVEPGGAAVLSGMLDATERDRIREVLARGGAVVEAELARDGCYALVVRA